MSLVRIYKSGSGGGGGGAVCSIIAGNNIYISPPSGTGNVTINACNLAVEVLGAGTCSTVRCGVLNSSAGCYSASLGGRCNIALCHSSTISGGY